jgi:hypothetical protein
VSDLSPSYTQLERCRIWGFHGDELLRHVTLWLYSNISVEHDASIFRVEVNSVRKLMVCAYRPIGLEEGSGLEIGQSEPWVEEGIWSRVRANTKHPFLVSRTSQVNSVTVFVLLLVVNKYKYNSFLMAWSSYIVPRLSRLQYSTGITSAFGDKPRRMLKVFRRFGKIAVAICSVNVYWGRPTSQPKS